MKRWIYLLMAAVSLSLASCAGEDPVGGDPDSENVAGGGSGSEDGTGGESGTEGGEEGGSGSGEEGGNGNEEIIDLGDVSRDCTIKIVDLYSDYDKRIEHKDVFECSFCFDSDDYAPVLLTIDWGDGSEPEECYRSNYGGISHVYEDGAESHCITIKGEGITYLSVRRGCKSVDVSGCETLYRLFVEDDSAGTIEELKLTGAKRLWQLDIPFVESLDLSQNRALSDLTLTYGLGQTLDFSNNRELKKLSIYNAPLLTSLDLSHCPLLKDCYLPGFHLLSAEALNDFVETLPLVEKGYIRSLSFPAGFSEQQIKSACALAEKKGWEISYYIMSR